MDVARKIVILGREIGLEIGLEDVTVNGLIPKALVAVAPEEYMARIHESDLEMQRLHAQAKAENKVLRFVGTISIEGEASVGLGFYPADHAFSRIQLTDNIVQFTSLRYSQNPLIVQGPGAGPAVTAGGVFGDLLRLAAHLGTSR